MEISRRFAVVFFLGHLRFLEIVCCLLRAVLPHNRLFFLLSLTIFYCVLHLSVKFIMALVHIFVLLLLFVVFSSLTLKLQQ